MGRHSLEGSTRELQTLSSLNVAGLGYEVEYFRLVDHDVVHAVVPHVDLQVRAVAPVWLPQVPPVPLCGLGQTSLRVQVRRSAGPLCRACAEHLRDLDDWVRQAERHLASTASDGAGY